MIIPRWSQSRGLSSYSMRMRTQNMRMRLHCLIHPNCRLYGLRACLCHPHTLGEANMVSVGSKSGSMWCWNHGFKLHRKGDCFDMTSLGLAFHHCTNLQWIYGSHSTPLNAESVFICKYQFQFQVFKLLINKMLYVISYWQADFIQSAVKAFIGQYVLNVTSNHASYFT